MSYGDGIAGRSFKTNQIRIFVQEKDGEKSGEPSFYTPIDSVPTPEVLIAFPLQAPDDREGRADIVHSQTSPRERGQGPE